MLIHFEELSELKSYLIIEWICEENYRIKVEFYGFPHRQTLNAMNAYGVALVNLARMNNKNQTFFHKSINMYQEVLRYHTPVFGEGDFGVLTVKVNLAHALMDVGNLPLATSILEECLSHFTHQRATHFILFTTYAIARCYFLQGQFEVALPLFQQVIVQGSSYYSSDHDILMKSKAYIHKILNNRI